MIDTARSSTPSARHMPIKLGVLQLLAAASGIGLVIVDEVNGFATVGAGYLAPPVENPAGHADDRGDQSPGARVHQPQLADLRLPRQPYSRQARAALPAPLRDRHGPGESGARTALAGEAIPNTTLVRKDCINGFVGAIAPDGSQSRRSNG